MTLFNFLFCRRAWFADLQPLCKPSRRRKGAARRNLQRGLSTIRFEELEPRRLLYYHPPNPIKLPPPPSDPSVNLPSLNTIFGDTSLPSGSKILTGNDQLVPSPNVNAYGEYDPVGITGLASNGVGYDDSDNVIDFTTTANFPSLILRFQGQVCLNGNLVGSFNDGNLNSLARTETVHIGNTVGTYTFHATAEDSYADKSSFDGTYTIKPAFTVRPKVDVYVRRGLDDNPFLVSWTITPQSGSQDDPHAFNYLSHDPGETYADLYYNGALVDSRSVPDYVGILDSSWIDGFVIDQGPGEYAVVLKATNSNGSLSSTIPPGTAGLTGADGVLRFTIPGDKLYPSEGQMVFTEAGEGLNNVYLGFVEDGNPAASANDFGATITWSDPANGDHISSGTVVQETDTSSFDIYGSNDVPYVSAGQYNYSVAINNVRGGSATISGTVNVEPPTPPSIGSLSVTPGSITDAGTQLLTLTANNVGAFGGVTNSVQFYLDFKQTGAFDPNNDRLIASGGTSFSGYLGGLTPGTYTIYARAYRYTYNSELFSNVVSATLQVTPAPPVAQVAIPSGSETRVAANASNPLVANDGADDVAVVFSSGNSAFLQRYSADGNTNGGAIALSGAGAPSAIAMRGDGQFALVWNDTGVNGNIRAAIYAADGSLLAGPIQVSTASQVGSANTAGSARVAMDGSGNFAVTWSEGSYFDEDVYERRFSANGTARDAAPVKVNTTEGQDGFSSHISPDVGMDATGNFVVTWADSTASPSSYTIDAQQFDADGNRLSGSVTVGTTNLLVAGMARVAMGADGHFIVSWLDYDSRFVHSDILARRFDAHGNPLDVQGVLVNSFVGGDHYLGGIALSPNGQFLSTWTSYGQDPGDGPNDTGVYGQVFGADGKKMEGEFRIPTTTAGSQFAGGAVMDGRGHITATWSGNGPGRSDGVYLQRFIVNQPPTIDPIPVQEVARSGTITIQPVLGDVDGDKVSVRDIGGQSVVIDQTVTLASGSRVTLNGDESLNYQAGSGLTIGAADSFDFTVTDRNGATATTTVNVVVVGPTVTGLALTSPIDAGGGTALSGVLSDPGTFSPFRVSVDWADGAPETYLLGPYTTNFSISHDPIPGGATPGLHPVTVSIVDDNGAGAPATAATTTGLVAYWKGDGNTNDSAGGNLATFVNAPAPAYGAGQVGPSFRLDGTSSYLTAGKAVLAPQGSFSVDAWVDPTDAANGYQDIVSEIGREDAAGQYQLRLDPTGVVTFFRREGNGTLVDGFTTANPIPSGKWSHVTAVYSTDGTSFQVYVNGILQTGSGFSGSNYISSVPGHTLLGANDALTEHFGGLIDEVGLYNRALSAAEVQTLDSAGSAGMPRDQTHFNSFRMLDANGNPAPGFSTGFNVRDAGPQDVSAGPDRTVFTGATAPFAGAFTDPGVKNTVAWSVSNSNGQVIATSTQDALSFTPPAAGSYLVTFTVTDSLGTSASATAKVTALDPMPLATATTSFELSFDRPVIGADQVANYTLQSVAPDGGTDTVGPNTPVPLSVSYSGTTATLSFDPLPAGSYLLTVGSGFPGSNFLQAIQVGGDTHNTLATSLVLPADWVQGYIGASGAGAQDVDLYRLTLAAGDLISFSGFRQGGLAEDGSVRLRLFNASGADISNQWGYWGTFYSAAGGNYYLGVSAADNSGYDPNTAGTGQGGAWTGLYTLNYTMQNLPSVSEAVMSDNKTTFTVGAAGEFTVSTSGFPSPLLSETGSLPAGTRFTDNGDGTATLAGTPNAGAGGSYTFAIAAHNGISSDAKQTFNLTVNEAPAFTSANDAVFVPGMPQTFRITSTGFPQPMLTEQGALPSNVFFKDNGDGTASLTGTAPDGVSGSYRIRITAHNGVGGDAIQPLALHVVAPPTTAPIANNDTFVVNAGTANAGSGATGVLYNATSADGQPQNLRAALVSNVSVGSLALNLDGSFTYTPNAATFKGIDRFTYQVSEGPAVGNTATVTLLSENAALVDKLYHQVLHRSAEDAGLTFWTGLLDQGAAPDVVAKGIFNSVERLDPLVTQFYEQYLGRGTDPAGLAYWVADWQAKGDPRDVVENILASPEFFDDAGDTNSGFVTLLYQRVLQRAPETAGINYWVGLMSNPPTSPPETRVQVASQFYDTHEKHADLVDFLFGEYFNGTAPPDGAPYLNLLDQGQTETQVEQAIIDSPEYRNSPPPPAAGTIGRALYGH